MKVSMFTRAMNKDEGILLGGNMVLTKYFDGNPFGVYSNRYKVTWG